MHGSEVRLSRQQASKRQKALQVRRVIVGAGAIREIRIGPRGPTGVHARQPFRQVTHLPGRILVVYDLANSLSLPKSFPVVSKDVPVLTPSAVLACVISDNG